MSRSSFKHNKNRVLLHVDKCEPQTLGDILMILPFPKNIQPYIFLHKAPTRLIYCCTDGQKSPAKCSSSTSCYFPPLLLDDIFWFSPFPRFSLDTRDLTGSERAALSASKKSSPEVSINQRAERGTESERKKEAGRRHENS